MGLSTENLKPSGALTMLQFNAGCYSTKAYRVIEQTSIKLRKIQLSPYRHPRHRLWMRKRFGLKGNCWRLNEKSCFSRRSLPLPKLNMASCCQKSILPSRQNCRATRNNKHQLTLPTAWSDQTGILPILPHSDPDGFSRRFDSSGSASLTSTYSQIGNP